MTKGQLWQALLPELELKARQWAELDVFSVVPDASRAEGARELLLRTMDGGTPLSPYEWFPFYGYEVSDDYLYSSEAELLDELDSIARHYLAGFKHAADAAWEVMINES